jgi:hypothetical protein
VRWRTARRTDVLLGVRFCFRDPPSSTDKGLGEPVRYDEILEIWDAAKWHEHVNAVATRKAEALVEALEDIGQR